jgi:hypothetical protein
LGELTVELDMLEKYPAHAASILVLLLESLCEQAALEGEGVQRREGGRCFAGARAGQV